MKTLKVLLNSEKTYVILISVVLATLLLNYAFGSISLLILLIICFLNVIYRTPRLIKEYLPLIGLFLLMLLSLTWTINLPESEKGLQKFAPLLLVPLAFMFIPNLKRKGIHTIFDYTATSNTIFALVFVLNASFNFLKNHEVSNFFYHKLVSLFDLNAIYVSSFFLLSYTHLILKKKFNRIIFVEIFILFVSIILLSSKLIIFLLFLITIIIFFKVHISKSTKLAIVVFLIFGAILISQTTTFKNRVREEFDKNFLEVTKNNDFSENFYPWSGSSIRLFQIRVFSELLKEDNFFLKGYGVNASQSKIIDKHKKYKLYNGFYHYNFHNQYLQIFSEIGVIGLLLIVIVLFLLLKQFIKTSNMLVLVVFVLFAALFFTESYLTTQRGIINFIIYMCLMFFPEYKLDSKSSS